ncbi:MAG TPA: stage II sporulation protein M [Gemmatimonadales bacterium]|nr:stage II sporulation protein M [Gemmatimonadales bacterium]
MSASTSRPSLTRHLAIETPEHVRLDHEIAGLGSRAAAALVDQAIIAVMLLALVILRGVSGMGVNWTGAVAVLAMFGIWYGYFTFFEALRDGQTPGKRMLGIRVVMETGHPISVGAAVIRNLLRTADFLPPPYLLGAILVAVHPRARRLGDLVAGTVVVRDQPQMAPRPEPASTAVRSAIPSLATPRLSDADFQLLGATLTRLPDLAPEARRRLLTAMASRVSGPLAEIDAGDDLAVRLETLHHDETDRRESGRGLGSQWMQLVTRQRQRWDEFAQLAERARRDGLDRFSAAELPEFAARYREIAADLARLRTYGAPADTIARVERLVAAGHNSLYRSDRGGFRRLWRVLAIESPAAVVSARWYVLAGFLAFMIPGTIGYRMLRDQPERAEEVLSAVMLERAAAGVERAEAGDRYVSVAISGRPFTASWIITNNVRIAFFCFAGGIFAGVGALVLLGFNGLQLGAAAGHFANVGLFAYLGEFVLSHGVLELTAIWIAGGAGFMLGYTLIVPGRFSRADALAVAGRRAVRMLGFAVVCLVVAGVIEGFVSTSGAGWAGRFAASGITLAFLAVYLGMGTRYAVGSD